MEWPLVPQGLRGSPAVSTSDPASQRTGGKDRVVNTAWGQSGWVCHCSKGPAKLRYQVEEEKELGLRSRGRKWQSWDLNLGGLVVLP